MAGSQLSPAQIRTVTFDTHRRGYHAGQVDAFLEEVTESLEQWIARATEAEAALAAHAEQAPLASAGNETEPAQPQLDAQASEPVGPAARSAAALLERAQRIVDEETERARAAADGTLADAERQAEELLLAATLDARSRVEAATAEAEAVRAAAAVDGADVLRRVAELRERETELRDGVAAVARQALALVSGDPVVPSAPAEPADTVPTEASEASDESAAPDSSGDAADGTSSR